MLVVCTETTSQVLTARRLGQSQAELREADTRKDEFLAMPSLASPVIDQADHVRDLPLHRRTDALDRARRIAQTSGCSNRDAAGSTGTKPAVVFVRPSARM